MKLTAEFLADCGRRILAVTRGVPRRQVDNLAAECGIVIGELCTTTETAEQLTNALVAHPMPRWDFANFRSRAAASANATRTQAERDESESEWKRRRAAAKAAFDRLPPHKQQSRILAWRRKIDALLEENPDAEFHAPWKYTGGATVRARTLVNLPDYQQQLEGMAISEIMETQYQQSIAQAKTLRPKTIQP
jgi:hypothetical protein